MGKLRRRAGIHKPFKEIKAQAISQSIGASTSNKNAPSSTENTEQGT